MAYVVKPKAGSWVPRTRCRQKLPPIHGDIRISAGLGRSHMLPAVVRLLSLLHWLLIHNNQGPQWQLLSPSAAVLKSWCPQACPTAREMHHNETLHAAARNCSPIQLEKPVWQEDQSTAKSNIIFLKNNMVKFILFSQTKYRKQAPEVRYLAAMQ